MIKARTWLALGLMSVGTLAAVVGCGSDETTGPGGGLITAGSGGTTGGSGGTGAVGRGGSTSTAGSSGSGSVASGNLGATCASDLDCGSGLTCLLATGTDLGAGGPANGVCSLACKTNSDCQAAEAGAGCVLTTDTTGFCFESCTTGEPSDSNSKCQGRQDFLCYDLSQAQDGSATLCQPFCQGDAECPTGEYCNNHTGLCATSKPTGKPTGTACDPSAATDPCLGFCLQLTQADTTTGACAELCAAETACNFTGTKPGGICIAAQGLGLLDPGFCENSCNCDSDCLLPNDVCLALDPTADAALIKALGTAGYCFPKSGAAGGTELSCAEGGAGGAGNTPGGTEAGAGGAAGAH